MLLKNNFILGKPGFCSSDLCMNGGACRENIVRSIRHAYCQCPAGYRGPLCENRTYFDSLFSINTK